MTGFTKCTPEEVPAHAGEEALHWCRKCQHFAVEYVLGADHLHCKQCDWTSDQAEKFEFEPPLTDGDGI